MSEERVIRNALDADHGRIVAVVDDWWGGQPMADMLQRLFFQHFGDTSFIAEGPDGAMIGFLVGFLSQSKPSQAYIHFVGVAPHERRSGLGALLYETFITTVSARGCTEVGCITGPSNTNSIAFHTALGFEMSGPHVDYDGPGRDRMTFRRLISPGP